ncbi:MAG: hypothetical protein V7603_6398, partial [Micromonosporaceae bacterium]
TIAGVAADGTVVPGTAGRVNPAVAGGSADTRLFSQVFGAGVAAAGAALGDRFGGIKLPATGGAGALPAAVALTATTEAVPTIRGTGAGGPGKLAGQSGKTAGDGTGDGGRIAPWLVKTGDVWYEPATIVPSMISGEPPSPVNRW